MALSEDEKDEIMNMMHDDIASLVNLCLDTFTVKTNNEHILIDKQLIKLQKDAITVINEPKIVNSFRERNIHKIKFSAKKSVLSDIKEFEVSIGYNSVIVKRIK